MMTTEEKIKKIEEAQCFEDVVAARLIPDPDNVEGYFFIYYPKSLYKEAFIDILNFIAEDIHIFYDRRNETGESYEFDLLEKIEEYKCMGVLIYLDESALFDPLFQKVCRAIRKYGKSSFAINYCKNAKGETISGAKAAAEVADKLDDNALKLYRKMFSDEVTYVAGDAPFSEKLRALKGIKKPELLEYAFGDDYAVVTGIRDIFIDNLFIPENIERDGKIYPVVAIAGYAFANCSFLTSVAFPKTLYEVGGYSKDLDRFDNHGRVFSNCKSLRRVIFPATTYAIYDSVFDNCTALKHISATGVKFLSGTFLGDGCNNLKKIILSSNVKKIGEHYFIEDVNEEIDIPANVEVVGAEDVLADCNGEFAVTMDFDEDLLNGNDKIKKLLFRAVEDELQTMSASDMPGLESMVGKDVAGDIYISVRNCEKLRRIECSGEEFGEIYIQVEDCPELESIECLGQATDNNVFIDVRKCPNLTTLTLPNNVGWIELDGLKDCLRLNELYVPQCHGIKKKSESKIFKRINQSLIKKLKKRAEKETDKDEKAKILSDVQEIGRDCLGELRFRTLVINSSDCFSKAGNKASDDDIIIDKDGFHDSVAHNIAAFDALISQNNVSKVKKIFQKLMLRILVAFLYLPLWLGYVIARLTRKTRLVSASSKDETIVTVNNIAEKMPYLKSIYIKGENSELIIKSFRKQESDRNGYERFVRRD